MPDAVYVQALDQVAAQLVTLGLSDIYTTATSLTVPEVRFLDWKDITAMGGLTVRYDEGGIKENPEGTNYRDWYAFPCHIIHCQGYEVALAPDIKQLVHFFQKCRQHFHNRRRMSLVDYTDVNQTVCTVTDGPSVPRNYRDFRIRALTVWAWFFLPRLLPAES